MLCVGGNTAPATALPVFFCAGIGPLQLGVVLVMYSFGCNKNTIFKTIFRLRRGVNYDP